MKKIKKRISKRKRAKINDEKMKVGCYIRFSRAIYATEQYPLHEQTAVTNQMSLST